MGRGVFFGRREDVLGDRVENARIFSKELDVEDFLRIREAEVFKSRVETGIFGSEVGDPKRGRYTSTSQDNNIPRLLQQPRSIIQRIPLRQLNPLLQLPRDADAQQRIVLLILRLLKEERDPSP